jgi:hypothetical protein
MSNNWPLLLSSPPPRTLTANLEEVKGAFNACHAWFKFENGINYVYEEHYVSSHPKAQGGSSAESGLPPHIYIYQDEHFVCIEGVLGLISDEKETFLKLGDAEINIKSESRHKFWTQEGGGVSGNMVC